MWPEASCNNQTHPTRPHYRSACDQRGASPQLPNPQDGSRSSRSTAPQLPNPQDGFCSSRLTWPCTCRARDISFSHLDRRREHAAHNGTPPGLSNPPNSAHADSRCASGHALWLQHPVPLGWIHGKICLFLLLPHIASSGQLTSGPLKRNFRDAPHGFV